MMLRGILMLMVVWNVSCFGATAEDRFARAATAYDEARYTDAVDVYEGLLRDGVRSAELYFNLGNAYYRLGSHGLAILHYQNAQQLAPRDSDIRHNLQFVVQEADAVHVSSAWPARLLRRVSLSEWIVVATAAWWLTALYAGVLIWPGRRRGWGLTASTTVVILFIACIGIWQWFGLRSRPLVVVTQPGQEALFAPLETSTAHFALPEGSLARVDTAMEGWYRISIGDKDGWIRQSAVVRVAPWESTTP